MLDFAQSAEARLSYLEDMLDKCLRAQSTRSCATVVFVAHRSDCRHSCMRHFFQSLSLNPYLLETLKPRGEIVQSKQITRHIDIVHLLHESRPSQH